MALGTNHQTDTTHANYIPEMWSGEVIGSFKANLVFAPLVTNFNHTGKKGDTIHIPAGTRGSASAKTAENEVTLITATEGVTNISIDQHFEYSILIEDLLAVQGMDSFRQFYTDDAGYALATNIDTAIMNLFEGVQGGGTGNNYTAGVIGGDGTTAFDDAANTNTGNGTVLTDAGIRRAMQTLDDSDVPLSDRAFVIPPVSKKNLLGLSRFTEQAFTGEAGGANSIRNGLVGDIYGTPVYVSTQCDNFAADDTSTMYRACPLFHKSVIGLVTQQDVRTQAQYIQQYLGSLWTADTIYGVGELRNDAGIALIVPA